MGRRIAGEFRDKPAKAQREPADRQYGCAEEEGPPRNPPSVEPFTRDFPRAAVLHHANTPESRAVHDVGPTDGRSKSRHSSGCRNWRDRPWPSSTLFHRSLRANRRTLQLVRTPPPTPPPRT